jgi:hypothetical protein
MREVVLVAQLLDLDEPRFGGVRVTGEDVLSGFMENVFLLVEQKPQHNFILLSVHTMLNVTTE